MFSSWSACSRLLATVHFRVHHHVHAIPPLHLRHLHPDPFHQFSGHSAAMCPCTPQLQHNLLSFIVSCLILTLSSFPSILFTMSSFLHDVEPCQLCLKGFLSCSNSQCVLCLCSSCPRTVCTKRCLRFAALHYSSSAARVCPHGFTVGIVMTLSRMMFSSAVIISSVVIVVRRNL